MKKNSNNNTFIGGFFPKQLAHQFKLFCLFRDQNKTSLLKEVVESYLTKHYPVDIIKNIANREMAGWQVQVKLNTGKIGWETKTAILHRFKEYVETYQKYLEKHGISTLDITSVIKEIKRIKHEADKEEPK